MSTYSIREMAKLSGIKAPTIRIWEQRYQLIQPHRTDTNIRRYSDDDLMRLMNISILNQNGYKISRIAQMNRSQLEDALSNVNNDAPSVNTQIEGLIMSMVALDSFRFNDIFENSVKNIGFEATAEQLLIPFLEKIGMLWLIGSISPGQEHFVTNLIRQKLLVAIDNEQKTNNEKRLRILFYLPEGEFHENGLLYYNYLARKYNFEVIYLGTSVPFRDIVQIDKIRPVDLIFTSFITSIDLKLLEQKIKEIKNAFAEKPILIGGRFIEQVRPRLSKNFRLITSPSDFRKTLFSFQKKDLTSY